VSASASASLHPTLEGVTSERMSSAIIRNHINSKRMEEKVHDNDDEKKPKVELSIASILDNIKKRDGHKKEFVQCAEEILHSLEPLFEKDHSLLPITERLLEPERAIQFRVAWVDDAGKPRVNRAWRVQYSSAIGPYKGGLRFHPTVTSSVSSSSTKRNYLNSHRTLLRFSSSLDLNRL
jgi:Glu/Leu/Phe/Val dehydrogenase, dimerisation domain